MINKKFQVGQIVECLPHFNNEPNNRSYGGAGYKAGSRFVVKSITEAAREEDGHVCFAEGGLGVYTFALKIICHSIKRDRIKLKFMKDG